MNQRLLIFLNTFFLYFNTTLGCLHLLSGTIVLALFSFSVAGLNYFSLKMLEN